MLSGMLQQAIIMMGECEGQQSASIQYCTSIRTELGETERERERARGRGEPKAKEMKRERERERERESCAENERDQRKVERNIGGDRWKKKHTRGNPQAATD